MKINISHKSGSPALHAEMRTFLSLLFLLRRTIQCLKSFHMWKCRCAPPGSSFPVILNASNNISAADLSRTGSVPLKISIPPHLGEQREPPKSDRKRRRWEFRSVFFCGAPFRWADTLARRLISAARSAAFPLAPRLPFIRSIFPPQTPGSHRLARSLPPK